MAKKNKLPRHKALEKLGFRFYSTSKPSKTVLRQIRKQGFHDSETWNLDMTMVALLYERLVRYKEVSVVDTDSATYDIKGKTVTVTQAIDSILEDARTILNEETYFDVEGVEDNREVMRRIWETWAIISPSVWW